MEKLKIYRGTTFVLRVLAEDSTGAPMDLTGKGVEFVIKVSADDPDPGLLEMSVGSGITLDDQTLQTGYLTIKIPPATSDTLTTGLRYCDVIVIDGSDRYPIIEGKKIEVANPVNHLGGSPVPLPIASSRFGHYVKKSTPGSLALGKPVYTVGQSGGYVLVEEAQAGITGDAIGIITVACTDVIGGYAAVIGEGIGNTTGMTIGGKVFLGIGAITATPGTQGLGTVLSIGNPGAIIINIDGAGAGVGVTDGDKTDIVVSAAGSVWAIKPSLRIANYAQTYLQQRYYMIDPVNGIDTNVGYIDGALDATFTAPQRVGIPLKTYDEFLLRLEKHQAGRKIVLLVAPMADNSVLLNKALAPQNMDIVGVFGTNKFQIRGSDLSNDLNDKTIGQATPFETPVGDPSGDGSWTMTGAGAGYFDVAVAPTQACLGKRVRSATGTTYATAAVLTTIRAIVGTRVYVRGTLTPVIGERIWIERPKVRFNRCNVASATLEDVPPNTSTPAADALTFVGLDFASDMRVRGVRGVHRLSFVTMAGSLSWLRGDQLLATTVWIDQDVTGAYTNRTSGAGFTQVGSTCTVSVCAAMNLQACAITAAMSFSTIARFNIQFGSALRGTVQLIGVGGGAGLGSSAAGNSFIGDSSVFPSCSGQITVRESSISFLNIESLNNTAAFININAKGSVITLDGITSPYGGNTDVILDLTNSAGSTVICGRNAANTATATLGAVRQFGGALIPTFTELDGTQTFDGARNSIIGAAWISEAGDLANWPLTKTRYYFVNNLTGDDTRRGYIEATHGTSWADATFGDAVALKTLQELFRRIPRNGDGRKIKMLVKGNAAAVSSYTMLNKSSADDGIDVTGILPYTYSWFGIQVSDFTNSGNDRSDFARRLATSNPSSGDGSYAVQTYAAGLITIATGTIPTGTAMTGFTIRWKGNVTAGLRNRTAAVLEVTGSTTVFASISTAAGAFPAVGDEFFIERPSVRIGFIKGAPGDMSLTRRTDTSGILEYGALLAGFEYSPATPDARMVYLASASMQSMYLYLSGTSFGIFLAPILGGWSWFTSYVDETDTLISTRIAVRLEAITVNFIGTGARPTLGGGSNMGGVSCIGNTTVTSVIDPVTWMTSSSVFGRLVINKCLGHTRISDGTGLGGGGVQNQLRLRSSTSQGLSIRSSRLVIVGVDISGAASNALELVGQNDVEMGLISGSGNAAAGVASLGYGNNIKINASFANTITGSSPGSNDFIDIDGATSSWATRYAAAIATDSKGNRIVP